MTSKHKRIGQALLTVGLLGALAACGASTPPGSTGPGGGGAAKGVLTVQNLDVAPFQDRLVFNRVGNPVYGNGPVLTAHEQATARLTNASNASLTVESLSIDGPWRIEGAPALPRTLAPGERLDLNVRFTAGGPDSPKAQCSSYSTSTPTGTPTAYQKCTYSGSLTIATGNTAAANTAVQLAGFWQPLPEAEHEPSLQEIATLFGYSVNLAPNPGLYWPYGQRGQTLTPHGEEVVSAYWQRADAAQPVTVRSLAMFHGRNSDGSLQPESFGWYPQGTYASSQAVPFTQLLELDPNSAQALRPLQRTLNTAYALNGVADATFTPGSSVFGFRTRFEYTDPQYNTTTFRGNEALPCTTERSNQMRFWPTRDRSGAPIPDTYFVGVDFNCDNLDYQDVVLLISNVKPAQ